ncbi:MAG TPA: hypothetical protein VL527_16245 [Dongiaceae bacterium]|nr:hypothetical protein [Dongiaceae bacterium]
MPYPFAPSPLPSTSRKFQRCGGFLLIEAPYGIVILAALAFLALAVTVGLAGYMMAGRTEAAQASAQSAAANALPDGVARTFAAAPGPWGDLTCQRSVVELPEDYLGLHALASVPVKWFFRGYSSNALTGYLTGLQLPAAIAQDLLAPARWQITDRGIYVQPTAADVLNLPAEIRNRLYAELGKCEENVMQNQPFHWPLSEKPEQLFGRHVTPTSIALFQKLSYTRGQFLLFSDWQALLQALPDESQRSAVVQSLMGRFVLFVSLKVTPQTDIEALIRYWGNHGNAENIRPILEAATHVRNGTEISIASLLPPGVRARINTFPLVTANELMNCHWSAFNFFAEHPDPPAGFAFWRHKLETEYEPATGPHQFGDLQLLIKPDGEAIHSCIFLADNIFYTKNGGSPFAPWQLTTLPDLLDFYSWDLPANGSLIQRWYRRRA